MRRGHSSLPLHFPRCRQTGLSLIELMIALALGMGIALASLALLNAAKSSYVAVGDGALVQDTGRYAIDVLSRAIRQANFVPYDHPAFTDFAALDMTLLPPGIIGMDNARLSGQAVALTASQSNAANYNSDVLAIRYFGSGTGNRADGSILNCAGFAVAAPANAAAIATPAAADDERGWSIFYVAADSSGEPELRCKYVTKTDGWSSTAIARGVEALQVLYGVGDHADDPVTQYRNASQMTAQQWRQVVAVRIAMLVRGEQNSRNDAPEAVYDLFGPTYRNGLDSGTTITELKQPHRMRRLFQATVRLRNMPP